MKCRVCENDLSKYKCPNCRISYCSLKCWRIHRDQQCEKFDDDISRLNQESTLDYYSFPTTDTVPSETLQLLGQNQGVRDTLYNPHTRNILDLIDKSKDPSSILGDAMQEPLFVQFVEECLKVVQRDAQNFPNDS